MSWYHEWDGHVLVVLSNESFVQFPFKLTPRWSQFREVRVNFSPKVQWRSWLYHLGPPKQRHIRTNNFTPRGAPSLLLTWHPQFLLACRQMPTAAVDRPKAPCHLQSQLLTTKKYFRIPIRVAWHEKANLGAHALWSIGGSAPPSESSGSSELCVYQHGETCWNATLLELLPQRFQ